MNYVRFQRGTRAAYEALKTSQRLNENTLYFIYPDDNNNVGELYMGSRIISGGDVTIASASLNDLSDVIISATGENSFLVQNANGIWESKSLEDIVTLLNINNDNTISASQVFQAALGTNEDDLAAINRVIGDATISIGDIAIVKVLIAADKYSYTAYVYNGNEWAAMDGNYNAKNVYFDKDLTITANIGVQEIDETGSKILDTTGKNLAQVFDMLLAARKLPERILPTVVVNSSESKSYEVGSSIAPSYTATLEPGNYTYGPDTNITASGWTAELNGVTINNNTGTFDSIMVTDNTNLKIAVTATYEDGAAPKDNLGETIIDTEELAQCQIQAGSTVGYASLPIKGYRNLFYGSKTEPIELNSANIRALTSKISTTNSFTMSIVENAKQVIIAVPVGRKVTKVADNKAFGIDLLPKMFSSIVSVGGADANANNIGENAKNYNVYVYAPNTALSANTYTISITNE